MTPYSLVGGLFFGGGGHILPYSSYFILMILAVFFSQTNQITWCYNPECHSVDSLTGVILRRLTLVALLITFFHRIQSHTTLQCNQIRKPVLAHSKPSGSCVWQNTHQLFTWLCYGNIDICHSPRTWMCESLFYTQEDIPLLTVVYWLSLWITTRSIWACTDTGNLVWMEIYLHVCTIHDFFFGLLPVILNWFYIFWLTSELSYIQHFPHLLYFY